jgi:GR25 family glycosyltransferase involved in LPS biosynthesis
MKKILIDLNKLNKLYNDLLFRDVDQKGIKFYLNEIETKNITFEWIENNIKQGYEYNLRYNLDKLFKKILGRKIDKYGYLNYSKLINEKSLNLEQLEKDLYRSGEFISKKLNGIDKIFYINLDRSKKRNNKMINLLNQLNIDFERFQAVDGNDIDINNIIFKNNALHKNFFDFIEMSNKFEVACTLSHLKLLKKILNEKSNYFLVLEDDINFENLRYFKYDLKKIIDEAPDFDILLLYKTSEKIPKCIYTKWDFNYLGTVAYVVNKKNLSKINDYYNIIGDIYDLNNNLKFNSADKYIYRMLNTYVYKYNIISTNFNESTIHKEHLEFHRICIYKNNLELKNL